MSEVKQLEHQLAKQKVAIKRRDMALKLSSNPDFKKLILDEFCVQECARYAQASGDPSLSAESRADSLSLAQAAGNLRRWLSVTVTMGDMAQNQATELENALMEARAEEGDE